MTDSALREQIATLIRKANESYDKKSLAESSENLDWPICYANYLCEPLSQLLQTPFTLSQIVYCLMAAAHEHKLMQPKSDKYYYFSDHFIEHFAVAENPITDKLALYYTPFCPYCIYVNEAIAQLNVSVEMLDINQEQKYYQELIRARNRGTVPVLRITAQNGEVRLLPESRDIVAYLKKTYG